MKLKASIFLNKEAIVFSKQGRGRKTKLIQSEMESQVLKMILQKHQE